MENGVAIGYNSTCSTDHKVRIGNSSMLTIEGQVAYSFPSDGRFKFNVEEKVPGLDFIQRLRPVTYQFDLAKYNQHIQPDRREVNADADEIKKEHEIENQRSQIIHTGFIAQEVEAAAKEIGFDFDGVVLPQNEKDNYGLRYSEFVVPLVKAVQELNDENNSLKERLQSYEIMMNDLLTRIEKLEKNQ